MLTLAKQSLNFPKLAMTPLKLATTPAERWPFEGVLWLILKISGTDWVNFKVQGMSRLKNQSSGSV